MDVTIANIPAATPEYCAVWLHRLLPSVIEYLGLMPWVCMPKSEWSGWWQAVGSIGAIGAGIFYVLKTHALAEEAKHVAAAYEILIYFQRSQQIVNSVKKNWFDPWLLTGANIYTLHSIYDLLKRNPPPESHVVPTLATIDAAFALKCDLLVYEFQAFLHALDFHQYYRHEFVEERQHELRRENKDPVAELPHYMQNTLRDAVERIGNGIASLHRRFREAAIELPPAIDAALPGHKLLDVWIVPASSLSGAATAASGPKP